MRTAQLTRETKETQIFLELNLDGSGKYDIELEVGFLKHMLELFSHHSQIDLTLKAKGDTYIDYHHLVEDIGILLGKSFYQALGDKKGIKRYGHAVIPMDEALIETAVDFSGRSYLVYNVDFFTEKIGNFHTELLEEFFQAFTQNAKVNLHIIKRYGKNSHHIAEGIFKSFAKSIKEAIKVEGDAISSTKGVLE